jgi:L-seryl-tRNA(Ser) seleniumtransferase
MRKSQTSATARPRDARRGLLSTARLLDDPRVRALIGVYDRPAVVDSVRRVLERRRRGLAGGGAAPGAADLAAEVEADVRRDGRGRLRRAVNATGVLLHTGLGRAVLPEAAARALGTLDGACNVQIDLDTGARGRRDAACEALLARLTGAEAAMLVNNNAAATLLILAALCRGREVVVSRGQLVEIGGSYRLPDCIHQSGAILVEVGTTNRTHLADFEAALGENTAALMRVNPSNFRVVGFTREVSVAELATLKQRRPVLVIDDLGAGSLVDLRPMGLPYEPTVQESLRAGADLVCCSGDKLIGGPQAGIIVGRRDLVETLRRHPLARMLRVGKLTAMALQETLRLFLDPDTLADRHPTLRMLTTPLSELRWRARRIVRAARPDPSDLRLEVRPSEASVGGGSYPGHALPSIAVAATSSRASPDEICRRLRLQEPPVVAHIADDAVLLDVRTLLPGEERAVAAALRTLAIGIRHDR